MYHKIFQLGEGQITAQTYYKEETGFGFVDPLHIPGKTHSEQSLYLGGWNLRKSLRCKRCRQLCSYYF